MPPSPAGHASPDKATSSTTTLLPGRDIVLPTTRELALNI
eukprot:CAMPEP_0119154840 /NCGR_PEP_ID=MMETSP1310-20130426/51359_1 /TAXON_ID=464262 /ORGANISM="Genus nov. species nov., Strain RCC2339" /LENGTH=39 /DNA_ID= /DNA_START= /DNA_END= /DNA_ORIENTATION=